MRCRRFLLGGLAVSLLSAAMCAAGCSHDDSTASAAAASGGAASAPQLPATLNPSVAAKVGPAMQAGAAMGGAEAAYHRAHPPTGGAPK